MITGGDLLGACLLVRKGGHNHPRAITYSRAHTCRTRTMKFGVYLETNMEPEWRGKYLRYGALKAILKEIVALNAEKNAVAGDHNEGGRLSTTLPRNLAAMSFSFMETRPGNSGLKDEKPIASESTFFEALDGDMKTVSGFVELTLARLVKRVEELDAEVAAIVRYVAFPFLFLFWETPRGGGKRVYDTS